MIIKGIRITVYCFVTYNCFNLFGEETHSCIILVGLLKKDLRQETVHHLSIQTKVFL